MIIQLMVLYTIILSMHQEPIPIVPTIVQAPQVAVVKQPVKPTMESLGTFKITAYCACEKCCGPNAIGRTRTGTIPKADHTIAVDPEVIPLGSTVIINGINYVAEDTGGAIHNKRIDIYFESHEEALDWGKRYCEVQLLVKPELQSESQTTKASM